MKKKIFFPSLYSTKMQWFISNHSREKTQKEKQNLMPLVRNNYLGNNFSYMADFKKPQRNTIFSIKINRYKGHTWKRTCTWQLWCRTKEPTTRRKYITCKRTLTSFVSFFLNFNPSIVPIQCDIRFRCTIQ